MSQLRPRILMTSTAGYHQRDPNADAISKRMVSDLDANLLFQGMRKHLDTFLRALDLLSHVEWEVETSLDLTLSRGRTESTVS